MATTAALTATIVNQAIKTGSCGSSVLRTKLEAKREQIASLFCLQATKAGKLNAKEQYLRILLEVLKIALLDSVNLVDITEATDNANRNMDQRTNSNRNGEMQETRQGTTATEMRSCGFRNWDRHRTGDDESNSTAISKSRANSYSFYKDASASKSASGEEGFGENDQQSEMEQFGGGTSTGTRKSQKVAFIKPQVEPNNGNGNSDAPVIPDVNSELPDCDGQWWVPAMTTGIGVPQAVECLSSLLDFASGGGIDGNGGRYTAEDIKTKSRFRKDISSHSGSEAEFLPGSGSGAGRTPGLGASFAPICSPVEGDSLCGSADGDTSGKNLWEARASALPPTFTNYYSGNYNFEFSISLAALGSGIGFTVAFHLQAGETFTQSARIDQSFDLAKSANIYCSDGGEIGAQKGRSENFSESAAQTKNDKRRRSEKSSETGSTLEATSIGTMRFSGKSKSGMDRNFSRTGNNTMQKTGLMEEASTASLVDTSRQKMESITRYRHQVTKMLEDLMEKTLNEIEQLREAKGRKVAPRSTAPALQYRCDSPMGRIGARYASRTLRHRYPLFPASAKISE